VTPELQQFMAEAGLVVGRSASTSGLVGVVAGLVLGLVVHVALTLAGAFRGGHRLAPLGRGVVGLWNVVVTATLAGIAGAAAGALAGAGPALLASDLDRDFFTPMGELAADTCVRVVAVAPDVAGVPAPPDAPAVDQALKAARDGTWAIPVAHARAVATGLDAALRGPEGAEVAKELVALAGEPFPPNARGLVQQGVQRVAGAVAAGRQPGDVDATLPVAWAALDEAAARDGVPGSLSHADLTRLAIDRVILPIGLRPIVGPATVFLGGALALLIPAWGLPVLLAWLLRRLRPASAAEG
jgi:hypothetical protein